MHAIDTNIWIYSQDNRDKDKQQIALELVATTRPLALPWQVGCEFVAASRKLVAHGFSQDLAWNSLEAMQAMADVVILPKPNLWLICRELVANYQVSFWDGMLLASCIDGGVTTLYIEDMANNCTIGSVRVINPFRP